MAEGLVKNPPWLMWGNSQTIELESNPINAPILTQQLVRIAYKRPENWTFLFYAELLTADPLPNRAEIDIDFNLTTGVGRSQVSLNSFEHYDFDLFTAQIGDRRYSTTVLGPDRSNLSGTIPPLSNVISEFPGQDIQLNTTIRLRCLSFAKAVVRIDAYFAPKVHIRPEWFKGNMAQEEDEGH